MVCAPGRSIIPELNYLSAQAHKPCSISHLYDVMYMVGTTSKILFQFGKAYSICIN